MKAADIREFQMYDFRLSQLKDDLSINEDGKIIAVDSASEVGQRVKIHLRRFWQEWFLNISLGVPYFEKILGEKNTNQADLYIRKEINSVYGVKSINSLFISRQYPARTVSVNADITTIYGTTVSVRISEG